METLNKNGVSITQTPGEEKYVKCCLGAFMKKGYSIRLIAFQRKQFKVFAKMLKNCKE